MREEDAEPDEIAVVAAGGLKLDTNVQGGADSKSPSTPGGHPIPKTVVEETSGNSEEQSHPEKKYKADTPADLVIKPPPQEQGEEAAGTGTKA